MAMQTGENEQALRKILDMTRLISIVILLIHFYYYCYITFKEWGYVSEFSDTILGNIYRTGLFSNFHKSKLFTLGFLLISLLGAKGRKEEKLNHKTALAYIITGILIYFLSYLSLFIKIDSTEVAIVYIINTCIGYLLVLSGGTLLSRIIKNSLSNKDIFNKENETFPQEERLLENEYSINLPARYHLKDKVRNSWINIINPFRALMVLGTPGSGKSYFVIRHVITQHIRKGFTMFVYDFKFDDLSKITYNSWLKYQHLYPIPPKFYIINFDDLSRTHRCNPLEPSAMTDITDAAESARTILLGLNKEWIKRQGDFFVESPINFLTAIIWYLRKYKEGQFCTLPHVIELMQLDYDSLFTLLRTEKEIEVLINPFVNAYLNDVMEQLEGQIASAKIAMARLSSPQLYYVLSGNDFTLDINNPAEPKIICMGNNPQKIQIYGAVLSLYVSRLVKLVNQKGKLKSSLIFDEFPTIYLNNMDSLIATARSNKVATCLGIQDFSQLRKDYGREQADVIMNITGNIVSGQVTGDTAKQLSERFGKIMQDRESLSTNSADSSISRSKQLESAVPPSKISSLSSGEFVGMVADDPDCKIELKTFHCQIINDHEALKKEQDNYTDIAVIRKLDSSIVQRNYLQIKQDVQEIVHSEIERLLNDPGLAYLVVRK
ncbi:type IV secretory system conjugative DNA transfer VirD4/TraG family protein [Flavobacterium granuli]|uniref:Type IV secretory system Conjugative DNA transfer n=2 Tax=Flavobacterium granuli TaxID=280093 RepID=A0A1M5RSN4_9FLAO|nr:type IV secretory system conjugative DNA transfer VirD4/TraG family protein [Flavobacterium granuli]SHH29297.1 Type IV secretory system Conjugative DNA transfer [Flavobacterium granuli]